VLYHLGLGRLLGHTCLLLTHVGRRTGKPHDTVAMVLRRDRRTGELVIMSGWGPRADWILNLRVHNALRVQVGREDFVPEQRFLSDDEAAAVAHEFLQQHPWRARLATTILGWGDLRSEQAIRDFVRIRPFVAFRPASAT
jgi:deazaflavin-dependent oxidoreductase (nitroreductase family)